VHFYIHSLLESGKIKGQKNNKKIQEKRGESQRTHGLDVEKVVLQQEGL